VGYIQRVNLLAALRKVVANNIIEGTSDKCPVCGQDEVMRVRDTFATRSCVDKHTWHYCPKHKSVVIGNPKSMPNKGQCTCI